MKATSEYTQPYRTSAIGHKQTFQNQLSQITPKNGI